MARSVGVTLILMGWGLLAATIAAGLWLGRDLLLGSTELESLRLGAALLMTFWLALTAAAIGVALVGLGLSRRHKDSRPAEHCDPSG